LFTYATCSSTQLSYIRGRGINDGGTIVWEFPLGIVASESAFLISSFLFTLPLASAPIISYGEDRMLEKETDRQSRKGGKVGEKGPSIPVVLLGYFVGERDFCWLFLHIFVAKQCIFPVGMAVKKGIEGGQVMAWLVLLLGRRCLLNGYVCLRAKRASFFYLSRGASHSSRSVDAKQQRLSRSSPIDGRVLPCRMLGPE